MADYDPSNLKDISVVDGGKTVAIVNKSGSRRTLNATQYLGSGKLASVVTIDGKFIKIKADDGKTVIKWNPQTGTISR